MKTTIISTVIATALITSLPAGVIQWMDLSPAGAVGGSVPSNVTTLYSLPGVAGPITITYTLSTPSPTRLQPSFLQNGNVNFGLDTWATYEGIGTISNATPPGLVGWDITFGFSSTVPLNTLVLGVVGLGQTTSFGGFTTTVNVLQNGLSLGDFNAGQGFGATAFTSASGSFSLQNSTNGPGGINPHWNTDLNVVQILDPVSSLTVRVNQIDGDGIQIALGSVIPEPSSALLAALTGLLVLRRKRG